MRSASAIGLAIRAAGASDAQQDQVADQFNRNFGLWREADSGGTIFFDLIFPRGVRLPLAGGPPLAVERVYQPAHNIGHFRYLESSQLNEQGQPTGEIANWDQVQFPFDPALRQSADLAAVKVAAFANPDGVTIRELYSCDFTGSVRVSISSSPSGYSREFSIAQSAKS
jgi:hypothetical protein